MADNTTIAPQAGGDTYASNDIGGVKYQRVKVVWGAAGTANDTSATNPLPTVAGASTSVTSSGPTSVTSAAADTLILASNSSRRGAAVFNDSTAILYLSLGTNAASLTAHTVQIQSKGYYEVPFSYSGQIRGIWSAANGFARVTEVAP